MEAKTKGAWLLHHSLKLQQFNAGQDFNRVEAAGKAGTLLSALSANDENTLTRVQVEALAKASNINVMHELDFLLNKLKEKSLVDVSNTGISVLGITTQNVLQHTSDVFGSLNPTPVEEASILLSEATSNAPLRQSISREYLSDTCKLTESQSVDLLDYAEQIGFVDYEELGGGDKVYFNGNLFRRDMMKKTQAVLASLTGDDNERIAEVEGRLKSSGCLPLEEVKQILGATLCEKAIAIAMYDINVVNNDKENVAYVTRPAAFSKFGNPFLEDALDLAKAFVSSLTYGMTRSPYSRGQIRYPQLLIRKLIAGEWIGPVEAIGQDYKVLEMRGVVKVQRTGRGYMMKLLKKEVGELAIQVISVGDASDVSLLKFPGATLTSYIGPEKNRKKARDKQSVASKKETRDIVEALRTGRAF